MSQLIYITDMVQRAIDRLPSQFRGKPRIEALLTAFAEQAQKMEDAIQPLYTELTVNGAHGAQLDLMGAIVGVSRRGRNDSQYRLAIILKIAINVSKGTPEEAIAIFGLLTGATNIHLFEYFPGVVEIYGNVNFEYDLIDDGPEAFAFEGGIDGLGFGDFFDPTIGGTFAQLLIFDVADLYRIMDSVLAAGVRLERLGWYNDTPFSFEGDPNGRGFGDVFNSTVGGDFAKIVPPA